MAVYRAMLMQLHRHWPKESFPMIRLSIAIIMDILAKAIPVATTAVTKVSRKKYGVMSQ
jgi:hypothetical protein